MERVKRNKKGMMYFINFFYRQLELLQIASQMKKVHFAADGSFLLTLQTRWSFLQKGKSFERCSNYQRLLVSRSQFECSDLKRTLHIELTFNDSKIVFQVSLNAVNNSPIIQVVAIKILARFGKIYRWYCRP